MKSPDDHSAIGTLAKTAGSNLSRLCRPREHSAAAGSCCGRP